MQDNKSFVKWRETKIKLRAACLKTHNIKEMLDFYVSVFGYHPDVDGNVDYRFYEEQLTIFHLTEKHQKATRAMALIYQVNDVDKVYIQLSEKGFSNMGKPTNKPWGVRSFMIEDPDGNTLSFVKDL